MASPKWDDTEEVSSAIPSWDDTYDLSTEEPISGTESTVRGAIQGGTMGYSDEMRGAIDSPVGAIKKTGDLISQAVQEPASELQGSPLAYLQSLLKGSLKAPESDSDIRSYELARDKEREANRLAQEANPGRYMAGELVGGVASSMVLPGARGLSLAKQVAMGAGTGALTSVGGSSADNLRDLRTEAVPGLVIGAGAGVVGRGMEALGKFLTKPQELYKAGKAGKALIGKDAKRALEQQANDIIPLYNEGIEGLKKTTGQAVGEAHEAIGNVKSQDFLLEQLNKIKELENTGVVLDDYPQLKQLKNLLESQSVREELPSKNLSVLKNQVKDLTGTLKRESPATFGGLDVDRSFGDFVNKMPEIASANKNYNKVKNLEELVDLSSKNISDSPLPFNKQATELVNQQKLKDFIRSIEAGGTPGTKTRDLLETTVGGKKMGIKPIIEELQQSGVGNPEDISKISSFLDKAGSISKDMDLAKDLNKFDLGIKGKIQSGLSTLPYVTGKLANKVPGAGAAIEGTLNPSTTRKLGSVVLPEQINRDKPQDLNKYLTTASNEDLLQMSDNIAHDYPEHSKKLKEALQTGDNQTKNAMIFLMQQNKSMRKKALGD